VNTDIMNCSHGIPLRMVCGACREECGVRDSGQTAIESTLAERKSRYGTLKGHARITQAIKRAMVDSPNWPVLSDDKKEALEMVAHKIGRILNGDPEYHDSWHDIIGYTKLIADDLAGVA
jgi:hypothetical protein